MVVLSDAMSGCRVEVQRESAVNGRLDGGRKCEPHTLMVISTITACAIDRNEAVLDECSETSRIKILEDAPFPKILHGFIPSTPNRELNV